MREEREEIEEREESKYVTLQHLKIKFLFRFYD